jgi:TetR/AcrR family acrAB operon transcriptional repressor
LAAADGSDHPRVERILDAAARLISHYGYDKTTVSDIAEAAGVSKGAIYLHYKSKEELFEALIFREGEKLVADLLDRIERDPQGGTLFGLYQHAILASISNPLIHALMTRDSRVLGDLARRWRDDPRFSGTDRFFRLEMVQQLQAARVIRDDLDASVITYILTMIRYGFLTVNEVIPMQEAPPLDEVGRTLGLMLETALAPPGGADLEAGKRVLTAVLERMRRLVQRPPSPQ